MRKKALCKNLESDWENSIDNFLLAFKSFMVKSDSIGLTNLHMLTHVKDICSHYKVGLATIGNDSTVETCHSDIVSDILPHLGPSPNQPDNKIAYSDENLPPVHVAKYYKDLYARALEISLNTIDDKSVQLTHTSYGQHIKLDNKFLSNFMTQLLSKPQIHFDLNLRIKPYSEYLSKLLSDPIL